VTSCRDELAQQYLMQAVIQGFPDAFHLGTLDALLGALPDLQPGVKLHAVMASLMERLARCAGGGRQAGRQAMACTCSLNRRANARAALGEEGGAPASTLPTQT
jgi:vacuolar protein sorting-associated protein 35